MHASMCMMLATRALRDERDDVPDVLGLAAVRHQDGVPGFGHDQAVDPEGRDEPLGGVDDRVGGPQGQDVPGQRVVAVSGLAEVVDCLPRADIAPAHVQGHHDGVRGLLHQGVVDGDVRRVVEGASGAEEVHVLGSASTARRHAAGIAGTYRPSSSR